MRYYWIIIIVIILPLIIIGIYYSTIFNFLASSNPFPERLLLIILTAVTGIVGISSLFVHFLERKKIPILEFNIFTKTNDTKNTVYFVRVKNTSGEGMAEKCEGWITVEGSHSQTVWANQSVNCNIPVGLRMDLRFFAVKNNEINISPISKKVTSKQFFIPTLNPEHQRNVDVFTNVPKEPYEDYIEKEITIYLGASRGHIPKPLTKKISDIINDTIIEY